MSEQLERYAGAGRGLDLETIRNQLAPKASIPEVEHFALVCRHLGLDPFVGHIHLIGRNQKVGKEERGRDVYQVVHRPQIAVAGRRAIASRTGRLQGIDGPVWCGPRDPAGELVWRDVWDDDYDYPYAARCLVWPAGWKVPANGTVKWSEFAQYTDRDRTRVAPFWERAPSHMLGKVAEALALRRAFPEVEVAVGYVEGGRAEIDDAELVAEAEADTQPGPVRPTAPALAGPRPAPNPRSASRRPRRDEGPPPEYYDNLPEANR